MWVHPERKKEKAVRGKGVYIYVESGNSEASTDGVDGKTSDWKFRTLSRPNWELPNFRRLELSGPMRVDGKTPNRNSIHSPDLCNWELPNFQWLELPNRMRVDQITLEWKFHTLFRPYWELLNFQWLQLSGPMQVDGKTSE